MRTRQLEMWKLTEARTPKRRLFGLLPGIRRVYGVIAISREEAKKFLRHEDGIDENWHNQFIVESRVVPDEVAVVPCDKDGAPAAHVNKRLLDWFDGLGDGIFIPEDRQSTLIMRTGWRGWLDTVFSFFRR